MKYKLKMNVGDPSQNGHNKSETVYFMSNKTAKELKKAYLESCKLTGLVFDGNTTPIVDGVELDWRHIAYNDRAICIEYESFEISDLATSILQNHGIETKQDDLDVDYFVELFFKFIKLSLVDFEYELSEDETELLDITIGYGLFE